MIDYRDALLRRWAVASAPFLTNEAIGYRAMEIVASVGAVVMARALPADAECLAFAAVWQISRRHPMLEWYSNSEDHPADVAGALSVFSAIQDWSLLTGLSPFVAGLSRSAAEAMTRYEAASFCARISEEYGIGERGIVTCWYQAAHREAFRLVMMRPQVLPGEDMLPEEMIRVAAAAHIARLSREPHAAQVFGQAEIEAVPDVEEAVRRSSRRAIEQQKARNRMLTDQLPR